MDYVVNSDGTITHKDGRPYTGYIRDSDWYDAVARGRRPVRYRPKSVLRAQGQPHNL